MPSFVGVDERPRCRMGPPQPIGQGRGRGDGFAASSVPRYAMIRLERFGRTIGVTFPRMTLSEGSVRGVSSPPMKAPIFSIQKSQIQL
jgi:hypothetical protein